MADAKEKPEETTGCAEQAKKRLDLRGVFCPVTLIRTKMALREMKIGDILTVVLNKLDAAEDMPPALKNDGQKVLTVREIGESEWEVDVQKAK